MPRLEYLYISRYVETEVVNTPEIDSRSRSNSRDGSWSRELGSTLVTAFGAGTTEAHHRSEVTDLGLVSQFFAGFEATHGASSLELDAVSSLAAPFRVSEPIMASLEGTLELTGDSGVSVSIYVLGAGVDLAIYDLRGHLVARLLADPHETGSHVVTWDGRDGSERPVPSGQYFAVLKTSGPRGRDVVTRKITVVR